VQRPEGNEGGREEEERSLGIAVRKTGWLHGAKLVAGWIGLRMNAWSPDRDEGSAAVWRFARQQRWKSGMVWGVNL
jgi:hypothetical protein